MTAFGKYESWLSFTGEVILWVFGFIVSVSRCQKLIFVDWPRTFGCLLLCNGTDVVQLSLLVNPE